MEKKKIGRLWWENPSQIRFKLKEENFFFSSPGFPVVQCCLVSNLSFKATTVFYDLFDSVGRHHLGKKLLRVWFSKIPCDLILSKMWLWLNSIFLWFFMWINSQTRKKNVLGISHVLVFGIDCLDIVAGPSSQFRRQNIKQHLKYLPIPLTDFIFLRHISWNSTNKIFGWHRSSFETTDPSGRVVSYQSLTHECEFVPNGFLTKA